jgi:hypothetical protein
MSAPTMERTATRVANAPRRATVPTQRTDSGAVGRAYARRAGRRQRLVEPVEPVAVGRSRFVLLVMALLGVGLVASLGLSTTAAADSYRLEEASRATRDLSERSESLRTEIAVLGSPAVLAQHARDMGMVPAEDVARLVRMPDGKVVVVGTPKAAAAAPPAAPVLVPAPVDPNAVVPNTVDPNAVVPGTPAQTVPGQTVPGQTVPQQTVPQQTAPGQTAPRQLQPQQAQPQQVAPQQPRPVQPGEPSPAQLAAPAPAGSAPTGSAAAPAAQPRAWRPQPGSAGAGR